MNLTFPKEENKKKVVLLSGPDNTERKQMSEIMEMSKLSQTNNFLLCLATIKHVLAAGESGGGIPSSGGSGGRDQVQLQFLPDAD